jgi:hypothetical protein
VGVSDNERKKFLVGMVMDRNSDDIIMYPQFKVAKVAGIKL